MYNTNIEQEEIIGVYHDKKHDTKNSVCYFYRTISKSEYRRFSRGETINNLEAAFVISDKKFAGVEKQQWKLEDTDTLYADRIKISELASKAIYNAIYDFLVINTNERGAKNLRVKIETDALLTTVLLMEESFLFVGQEDGFSFFEINVENYE